MSQKALTAIHASPPAHWVGDGFLVQALFASLAFGQEVSPFQKLDYDAPHQFKPSDKPPGVGPKPHRGFETVTIVNEGELEHRDSAGNAGKIGAGDVQWMTAGSGVLHEEFHSREHAARGGSASMAQLWVNLPARDKKVEPRYQTVLADTIPTVEIAGGKGTLRVVAGAYGTTQGPAKTFTPLSVWDVNLKAGAELDLAIAQGDNVLVALLSGDIRVGADKATGTGLLTFSQTGDNIVLQASADTKLLVLSGRPLAEPIAHYGPFVMNTEAEIREAIDDFRRGKMGELEELV
ncbi:MAG: pirin [Hyphomicrobiales bacterium]|nr:pirin [Hyphomicrobiales bacterium]